MNYIEKTADQQGITLQKSAHIGALTDLSYVQLVNEVSWYKVYDRNVVVTLDNGCWAYASQISRK